MPSPFLEKYSKKPPAFTIRRLRRYISMITKSLLLSLCFWMVSPSAIAEQSEGERIAEVNSFSPIIGVWKGSYDLKWVEPALDGEEINKVYVRIKHNLNDHVVSFAYSESEKLQPIDATITMFEDQLGWIVHIQRSGGTWIEKYILTFARTGENQAESTFARTVHNWHIPEGYSTPNYFSMFGQGSVSREQDEIKTKE